MRRRSFLMASASVIPVTSLCDSSADENTAQTSAQAPPGAPVVIGAGADRFGHPHSLGFDSLLFKVATGETGGGMFVVEHPRLVPGGPPLHLHLSQEEWFYVMEGEVAFQVGDEKLQLGPGESILAPRRVPHTFSSVAEKPSRMLIAFSPAGKMERYFLDVETLKAPPKDPAFWRRYDMELVGPSPFWKA